MQSQEERRAAAAAMDEFRRRVGPTGVSLRELSDEGRYL